MLLVFIPLYALLAVRVAAAHFTESDTLAVTLYFAVAGLVWIFPAGLIIRWMQKPPAA
jgi:site-specific recombinase